MTRGERIAFALAVGFVLVVSALHPRRGLPCRYSLHQDAVAPLRALGFLARYADPVPELGDKYPTFAYLYFGAAARIALALRGDDEAAGLLDLARVRGPDAWSRQIDPGLWLELQPYEGALSDMIVAGRLASALANAVLASFAGLLVLRLARGTGRGGTPRFAAALGALLVGASPYVVFYGHTTNVDAPCLAFATAALYFVVRGLETGRAAPAILAGLAAALAAATKDQIVGYLAFVPVALIVLERRWRRAGRPSRAALSRALVATAAFAGAYLIAANLVFDPEGWVRHARFGLSDEVRTQYDMVAEFREAEPLRAIQYLFIYVGTYLYRSAGLAETLAPWRGGVTIWDALAAMQLALVLAGVGFALVARRAAALLLLTPAAGYLAVFVLRMGLAYPRHLLPVYLPAWLFAAAAVAVALGARARAVRALGLVGCGLVLAVAWRGAAVNRVLVADPRLRAAAWMDEHLPAGTAVLAHTNHATPPPRIPPSSPQRWASSRDLVDVLREFDPPVRVFVRSTVLKPVVIPVHPDEALLREEIPAVVEVFGREVWHPILDDIDAAPVVVIAARP